VRTSQQYLEKLRSMRPNVRMDGKQYDRTDPSNLGINNQALTFDLAQDPEYQDLFTVYSPLIGERVNRFTYPPQSVEDLLTKQEMIRTACHKTSCCVQRCTSLDMLSGMSVFTHEVDQAKKTEYYDRFTKFLKYYQKNDLVGCAAHTDVKGDRSLRPHQQPDPDMYIRIVEKRKDGIIVRGAKHPIGSANFSDEILVTPCRAITKEEGDWAVAFAIPADTEGIHLIASNANPFPRTELKAPVARYGRGHSMIIFDDVLIPWERVFLCGEWEFGTRAAHMFAWYHRHSYTGCKPATFDHILGMVSLSAEYSGIERAKHIQMKQADIVTAAELVYAAGIAAALKAERASSGTYIPDIVYCNVGRRYAGLVEFGLYELLYDVAGGYPLTLPHEVDFFDPVTGPLLNKYTKRKEGIPVEHVHRLFRMICDVTCSELATSQLAVGLHGGGSPVMEAIALVNNYDIESKKKITKYMAGIEEE